jgi:tetratricopeptide (TPR) repeat protein
MCNPRDTLPLAFVFVIAGSDAAAPEPSLQVPVGVAGIGMGSAYSAIAADASAVFWNPAGLSALNTQEVLWTHANLYDTGVVDDYVALASPLSRRVTMAADWYHSGFDDNELGFSENRLDLAAGCKVLPSLAAGIAVKYLARRTELDGVRVRDGSGFGLDVGILASPVSRIRVGAVLQDAFDTDVHYSNDVTASVYQSNLRVALACEAHRTTTVAVDVDDRYHVGGEFRPVGPLALRAGFEKDREGGEDATYSFGTGVRVGPFRFDYAYVVPPVLDATSHLAIAAVLSPAPRVQIESLETEDVFASLARHYEQEPVARVRLRNVHDRPIAATVSLDAPGLLDVPAEREVVLRPKAAQQVDLGATLSPSVLDWTEDRSVPLRVSVRYPAGNRHRTETKSSPSTVYGPGAIDWNRGVAQAAAFVTVHDPMVEFLARDAAHAAGALKESAFATRNIRHAAAIFESLGLLGVSYVPDPYNPYQTVSETPRAVDTVHYPRHTLASRTGDCDDTSVLLAALLANVGVRSKFVDAPGHLFLLVDSGLHASHRLALPVDPSLLVVVEDVVWLPIETTAIAKGFTEAWSVGASEYSSWSARGQVELVDVGEAMARFPASPASGGGSAPLPVGRDELAERLLAADATVAAWRDEFIAQRFGGVADPVAADPDALDRLARVHYLAGRFEESREMLEASLEREPSSARAHNNLAATYAAEGELTKAMEHLDRALAADDSDGGVWLNAGMVRHVAGDEGAARSAFRAGVERSGGLEPACRLLGVDLKDDLRADDAVLSDDEVAALLRAALEGVPATETPADSAATVAPVEPAEPDHPARLLTAGPRAAERFDLAARLYWKE